MSDELTLPEKSRKGAPPHRTPWRILFRILILVVINFGGLAVMAEYRVMEVLLAPGGVEKMPSVAVTLLFLIGRAGMYLLVPGLLLVGIFHAIFPWESRKQMMKRLLKARRATALLEQGDVEILHDPIEDDPAFADVLVRARGLAESELKGRDQGLGFRHLLWQTEKRILREQFGITWFSAGDLNRRKKELT